MIHRRSDAILHANLSASLLPIPRIRVYGAYERVRGKPLGSVRIEVQRYMRSRPRTVSRTRGKTRKMRHDSLATSDKEPASLLCRHNVPQGELLRGTVRANLRVVTGSTMTAAGCAFDSHGVHCAKPGPARRPVAEFISSERSASKLAGLATSEWAYVLSVGPTAAYTFPPDDLDLRLRTIRVPDGSG